MKLSTIITLLLGASCIQLLIALNNITQ